MCESCRALAPACHKLFIFLPVFPPGEEFGAAEGGSSPAVSQIRKSSQKEEGVAGGGSLAGDSASLALPAPSPSHTQG